MNDILFKDNQYVLEQFNIVLKNNIFSSVGGVGVAAIFYFLAQPFTDLQLLANRLGYMILINIIRLLLGLKEQKQLSRGLPIDLSTKIITFGVIVIMLSLGWASIIWLFFDVNNPSLEAYILITIAGVTAASVSSLSSLRAYFHLFIGIILFSLVFVFIKEDAYLMGLLIFLYWSFLAKTGENNYQNIQNILVLNKSNAELIATLQTEKLKAEKANALKSEFLANMSHEIRTPMNAVLGFNQILKFSEKDSEKLNYINLIEKSGTNLLQIIDDILDFSKLEKGQYTYQKVNIDSVQFFKSVINLLAIKAQEKSVYLKLDLQDDFPQKIYIDELRLQQILINLISNAIKFSPAKTVVTMIVEFNHTQQLLKVQVIDQGIGIAEHNIKNIFSPFVQADNSTTRLYGGTGLGLSICSKIITDLGGQIHVESELDKGSNFWFELPCEALKSEQISAKSETKSAVNLTALSGKILLVEDDLTNQLLIKKLLSKRGLAFEIANNGQEAIHLYQNGQFDLILMDENMPIMSGIEATKAIRQYEKELNIAPITIVALTANALVGDEQRFLESGMNAYLTKPIQLPKFYDLLENYLTKPI